MSSERRPKTRREDVGGRDKNDDETFETWWLERRKRGGIPSPRIQSKALAFEAWNAAQDVVA